MVKIAGVPEMIRDLMARLQRIQETNKMTLEDAHIVLRAALELNWQFIQSKRKFKTNAMIRGTLLQGVVAIVEGMALEES